MSNAVKIQIETNAKTVEKDLEKVNQKVKTLQKRNTLQNGLNNLNSINQLSGMNDIGLGKGLSALTSNIGSVNKLMNPWSAAIVACIAATKALYAHANKMVEQGMPTANETEKLNAQLASQFGAKGMINGSEIIKQFQLMSENGVASTEQLVTAFSRLLPVLNGNSDKAVEFVKRMADVEAATGISADSITSLIAQIEASGEVEDKMVKRLQKQNIPIYEALAKVYGTDIATVREMSKAHKIGVEEMRQALMDATEMYAGTAEALSATTEGAKASMEAAKGRAYEGAASGHNAVMRDYYGERQKYYDELADDAEWQNQQKVIGETIAQIQLLGEKIGDFCDSVGDESVGLIARLYDWLTGSKAEGEMNERAAQQGMRDLYEKFGPSDIGFKDGITSAQAEEAAKQLTSMLEAEQAKFRLMVDKKDMASGSEREALTAGVIA